MRFKINGDIICDTSKETPLNHFFVALHVEGHGQATNWLAVIAEMAARRTKKVHTIAFTWYFL